MAIHQDTQSPLTLSGLHIVVMFIVMVAGAGAGWGTLTSQLNSTREAIDRLEKDVATFQAQLVRIREHQIINEGIIDQNAADIERLKQLNGLDGGKRNGRHEPK